MPFSRIRNPLAAEVEPKLAQGRTRRFLKLAGISLRAHTRSIKRSVPPQGRGLAGLGHRGPECKNYGFADRWRCLVITSVRVV